jgi:hypothetical protein
VRLPEGGLWVHSPIALDDALRGEIDDLGEVRHIVAPNLYHHLQAGRYKEAYPSAKLHAAPGLAKKRPDLAIDTELGEGPAPWGDALEPLPVRGTMLCETTFHHPATRTLVCTDLVENFDTSPHWATRMYLKLNGIHGKVGVSRILRLTYRDRTQVRADIEAILRRDFDRVVLCHGNLLEDDAHAKVRESFAWL